MLRESAREREGDRERETHLTPGCFFIPFVGINPGTRSADGEGYGGEEGGIGDAGWKEGENNGLINASRHIPGPIPSMPQQSLPAGRP